MDQHLYHLVELEKKYLPQMPEKEEEDIYVGQDSLFLEYMNSALFHSNNMWSMFHPKIKTCILVHCLILSTKPNSLNTLGLTGNRITSLLCDNFHLDLLGSK
jgi:hypothetical protein